MEATDVSWICEEWSTQLLWVCGVPLDSPVFFIGSKVKYALLDGSTSVDKLLGDW
jgi:hypothetical protein